MRKVSSSTDNKTRKSQRQLRASKNSETKKATTRVSKDTGKPKTTRRTEAVPSNINPMEIDDTTSIVLSPKNRVSFKLPGDQSPEVPRSQTRKPRGKALTKSNTIASKPKLGPKSVMAARKKKASASDESELSMSQSEESSSDSGVITTPTRSPAVANRQSGSLLSTPTKSPLAASRHSSQLSTPSRSPIAMNRRNDYARHGGNVEKHIQMNANLAAAVVNATVGIRKRGKEDTHPDVLVVSAAKFKPRTERRIKKFWSEEEEEALREGVLKYGVGNWSYILKDQRFSILLDNGRSGVDLKDKWRNKVSYKPYGEHPIRKYIIVDERHQPIIGTGRHGPYVYSNRWPRDAAAKAATKDSFYGIDSDKFVRPAIEDAQRIIAEDGGFGGALEELPADKIAELHNLARGHPKRPTIIVRLREYYDYPRHKRSAMSEDEDGEEEDQIIPSHFLQERGGPSNLVHVYRCTRYRGAAADILKFRSTGNNTMWSGEVEKVREETLVTL